MTGYGYNSNLVQQPPVLPEVEEDWGQVADQQYYRSENDPTGLSNPLFYGSMGGWYNNYSSDGTLGLQTQLPSIQPPPGLAPPPKPRVSISDEELYQALNMSPLPPLSTQFQTQQASMNQAMPSQLSQLNSHPPIDYLSSEICFPSSSTYDSSGYNDSYQKPTTSKAKGNFYVYHPGNDGDDEESFGEPERYETMSPTFSIHSFAPTTSTNTAEAEDLEVELINNYIPPPRYTAADEIDIFLRTGTTDDTEYNDDSDSRPTTTYSHRSPKAPTPPASRPAYAQKLRAAAAQHPESSTAPNSLTSPVAKTSPLFLQTNLQEPAGFTPLLTPNSDALLQKKLSEVVHKPPLRAVGLSTYPAFPQQLNLEHFQENQNYQTAALPSCGDNCPLLCTKGPLETAQPEEFYPPSNLNTRFDYDTDRDLLPLLLDTFKPLPPPQITTVPVSVPVNIPERLTSTKKVPPTVPSAPIKAPRLSDQELESESQKLAFDVISNLFTNKKEVIARAEKVSAPKKPVARNLFCHEEGDLEKVRSQEPNTMSVLDDWETADDDDLTVRMENLLKDKKKENVKKMMAKPSTPPSPRISDWDPTFLAHVLEIYGVPDYKMQEDVVKAMESSGNGDCKVMWIERKVVFAVFENVAKAKNCLTLSKHDWLRFRSLSDSPKSVQDSAKTNFSSLSSPKKKQQTTATVARRMVENALGKKAAVSTEKRQEERNQLAAAKAAKKSTIQWD